MNQGLIGTRQRDERTQKDAWLMDKKKWPYIVIILFLLLVIGCLIIVIGFLYYKDVLPISLPSLTPTQTVTTIPSLTPTPTFSITPSDTPTETLIPSLTPSETPAETQMPNDKELPIDDWKPPEPTKETKPKTTQKATPDTTPKPTTQPSTQPIPKTNGNEGNEDL
jgi:hypothetical protein